MVLPVRQYISQLQDAGWVVQTKNGSGLLSSDAVVPTRYGTLPDDLASFLSQVESCVHKDQQAWFLTASDYSGESGTAFKWNEWERMSIEAADENRVIVSDIESYWNSHLPILQSVKNGYSYLACNLNTEDFGSIVYGVEPEFEECTVITSSFTELLEVLTGSRGSTGITSTERENLIHAMI